MKDFLLFTGIQANNLISLCIFIHLFDIHVEKHFNVPSHKFSDTILTRTSVLSQLTVSDFGCTIWSDIRLTLYSYTCVMCC